MGNNLFLFSQFVRFLEFCGRVLLVYLMKYLPNSDIEHHFLYFVHSNFVTFQHMKRIQSIGKLNCVFLKDVGNIDKIDVYRLVSIEISIYKYIR